MPDKTRLRKTGSWILAALLGALFVLNGIGKIQMSEGWIQRFAGWGYAPWFLYLTAALELVGGAVLFVPGLVAYGAGLLAAVMAGAAFTHLATGVGSPVASLVILALSILLARLRWPDRWRPADPR